MGISDLLNLYFLQSMWAMAPFRYMGVTQGLENLGHVVFKHEKIIGGDLGLVVRETATRRFF